MLIDWFTVAAQAVNFIILAWLMKHFLYQPILHAIDNRKKQIETQITAATQNTADAVKQRDDFNHKNKEFDDHREAATKNANDKVKAEAATLLDEAKKNAANLSLKLQDSAKSEQLRLQKEINHKTIEEVLEISRKVLLDLAGVNLEEQIVETFIKRMHDLKGSDKEQLVTLFKTLAGPVTIRSTLSLIEPQRLSLQNAIKESFSTVLPKIRFETALNLICGIELIADGVKVTWNVEDYLKSLEKEVFK